MIIFLSRNWNHAHSSHLKTTAHPLSDPSPITSLFCPPAAPFRAQIAWTPQSSAPRSVPRCSTARWPAMVHTWRDMGSACAPLARLSRPHRTDASDAPLDGRSGSTPRIIDPGRNGTNATTDRKCAHRLGSGGGRVWIYGWATYDGGDTWLFPLATLLIYGGYDNLTFSAHPPATPSSITSLKCRYIFLRWHLTF